MRRASARCASAHAQNDAAHLAIAALAAAPAAARSSEPTLKARAILPADATWPAPFPGAPNPEPVPAPGSIQPVGGFSALLKGPGATATWRCPTTASAARPTRTRSCCGVYAVRDRHGGKRHPDPRRDQPPRPEPPDPLRARQRRHRAALPHRRRLRHRVVPHRPPRHAVVRRRVRPVPAPHRRHRQGPRGAGPAARRAVAGLSGRLPAAGAHAQPRLLQRLRGHGDLAGRAHALPDARGPARRRRRQDDPPHVHVRHREAPLRGGLPRLPRRRPATSCPTDARWASASSRSNATSGPAAVQQASCHRARARARPREVLDELNIANPQGISLGPVPRRLRPRRPVQMPYRRSRPCCRSAGTHWRSSTTRTSARRAATRRCPTTATSSACGCHSEKLISPTAAASGPRGARRARRSGA